MQLDGKMKGLYRLRRFMKMFRTTQKSWGSYEILSKGDGYLVKKLTIKPGKAISYQRHHHREELWYVIAGRALFILNDETSQGGPGSTFHVPHYQNHKVVNIGSYDLIVIEVWRGESLREDDIERVG